MGLASFIFILALVFIAYTMLGYPLLLAFLARRVERESGGEFRACSVSVLLPVRNGERWIASKLDCILALDYPQDLIETLVISDYSTDGTDDVVSEYAAKSRVRLIR